MVLTWVSLLTVRSDFIESVLMLTHSVMLDTMYKNMRRSMSQLLSREACSEHLQIQQAEASQLMYDLLKAPEVCFQIYLATHSRPRIQAYYTHVDRFSVSTIFAIIFGIRCPRYVSKPIPTFLRLENEWEDLITPGHQPPIDLLPILRYVPERWAKWKGICRNLKISEQKFYYGLLDLCEDRVQRNIQNDCFMEHVLQERDKYGLTREMVAYVHAVVGVLVIGC